MRSHGAAVSCSHKSRPWKRDSYAVQAAAGPVHRRRQLTVCYTTLIRIYGNCEPRALAVLPMGAKLYEMLHMRTGPYSKCDITSVVDRLSRRPEMAVFMATARKIILWIALM